MSICSDSQAALKALQVVRTSHLVQQCQRALNDISTRHAVGLSWFPGHAGVRGNEIADELAKGGSALRFYGNEPALGASRREIHETETALGVSRREIHKRYRRWLAKHHRARWRGLSDTHKQAREMISGPCLGAKARFLSFNRTQSRAVTGLLTGHNTLRRHLHF